MRPRRVSDYFYLCLFVVACCSTANFVESRQVERRSGVEEMIAGLRSKAQHSHTGDIISGANTEGDAAAKGRVPQRINFQSEDPQQRRRRGLPPVLPPADGDVNGKNFAGPYPRPLTERNAGSPCKMKGLIVRREMGNTGVTAFQVILAGLLLDALGPSWSYYDDWLHMARMLRTERHVTEAEADQQRKQCRRKITINPSEQDPFDLRPFNITDGTWVRGLREQVCGALAPWNRGGDSNKPIENDEDGACIVLKIQGHWEHWGLFYRYREFIKAHVVRSAADMRAEYVLGAESKEAPTGVQNAKRGKKGTAKEREKLAMGVMPEAKVEPVADLVVYLRLGDKDNAGDVTLLHESGYYEEVLAATRHNHSTCWIVTQSIEDKRARTLATTHKCQLITNPSQYTDYTLLQAAPKTLVMGVSTFIYFPAFLGAATEVHYPAVGYLHNRHNVCMRQNNPASHLGQIRLPWGDPRMVYHDVYSRQFFLTFDELAAESAALPCDALFDQHTCDLSKHKYQFGMESRYCYRASNQTSLHAKQLAKSKCEQVGTTALRQFRSK